MVISIGSERVPIKIGSQGYSKHFLSIMNVTILVICYLSLSTIRLNNMGIHQILSMSDLE